MKNWVVLFALLLMPLVVFAQDQAIDDERYYECQIIDDIPECHEKHEMDPSTEVIPYAIRIDDKDGFITILSAQITGRSVRGRVALKDRLSRRVREVFNSLNPDNIVEGAFFDRPYLSMEIHWLSTELEFDIDTQILFTEMQRLGYGKTLITFIPLSQSTEIFITPEIAYSGLIPEINSEEEIILRADNIASWLEVFAGTLIVRHLPQLLMRAGLVVLIGSVGVSILVSLQHRTHLAYVSHNLNCLHSDGYNKWFVFNDFYHVDLTDVAAGRTQLSE